MSETPYMAQRRKLQELKEKQEADAPAPKKTTKKKSKKK